MRAVGFSYAKRERNHCDQPYAFPSSMREFGRPHVMHLMSLQSKQVKRSYHEWINKFIIAKLISVITSIICSSYEYYKLQIKPQFKTWISFGILLPAVPGRGENFTGLLICIICRTTVISFHSSKITVLLSYQYPETWDKLYFRIPKIGQRNKFERQNYAC